MKTWNGFELVLNNCRSLVASSGLALAVLLCAVSALTAAAAPAPYGAYLGCYDLTKMQLSSPETKVRGWPAESKHVDLPKLDHLKLPRPHGGMPEHNDAWMLHARKTGLKDCSTKLWHVTKSHHVAGS